MTLSCWLPARPRHPNPKPRPKSPPSPAPSCFSTAGGAENGSGALFSVCSSINARPMQPLRRAFFPLRGPSLLRSGGAMLQPEKYEAGDRNQDIAVKNDAGIAGGEIVRRDHLIDVTAGRAPEEAGRPNDGREPQIEASPERQQSHQRKAEAGEADLQLEGAVLPSDEARRQSSEKDVQDEIVEV